MEDLQQNVRFKNLIADISINKKAWMDFMDSSEIDVPKDWYNLEFENELSKKAFYELSRMLRDCAIVRIFKPDKLDLVAR